MLNKLGLVTLFLAMALVLTSCQEEFEVFEGGTFFLRLDEPKTLVDGSIIEVIEIEDSRCPSDTQCAWEGRSAVTLRWKRNSTYTLQMNDVEYVHEQVEQYLVTLLEVSPFPTTGQTSAEKLVKISIEIN